MSKNRKRITRANIGDPVIYRQANGTTRSARIVNVLGTGNTFRAVIAWATGPSTVATETIYRIHWELDGRIEYIFSPGENFVALEKAS